jgi:hypothetical protein
MRAAHRWGIAALATALVVLVPYAGRLRHVPEPGVSTTDLVAAVRHSAYTPYSGQVEVDGGVGLPVADHFTDLADLFGGTTRLRVWWRNQADWRVDRLLDTGEDDLFHHGAVTTEWDYERAEARISTDPEIRLPRDADLLPPEVARRALDGEPDTAVTSLPARRVAGVDAAGLRLQISDPRSSLRHVDLWVDPGTGVTLAARVYGEGTAPALTTTFTSYSRTEPEAALTRFEAAPGVTQVHDSIIDIADAADEFAPVRAPASVAGFARTSGQAASVYGRGLTRLLVVPLPFREADELAWQLGRSGAVDSHGERSLRVGPLGVMVTGSAGSLGVRWLVGGTVTDATLLRAAHDLASGSRPR